jgi:hypothetical protein
MPYEVKKVGNGWYVFKKGTSTKFSIRPFKSKMDATKQMLAIMISESKGKKR